MKDPNHRRAPALLKRKEGRNRSNVKETLDQLTSLNGFVGACVVDSGSGMMLGATGSSEVVDLEIAAAGNTEVVRAKRQTMKSLNLDDQIEDILITLGKQYHLIRPVGSDLGLFIYLVLDKERSNLAMGRRALGTAESKLVV